jgi:hypothetical protein
MTIPNDVKLPLLRSFYQKLEEPGWGFMQSNEKDKIVLEEFSNIQAEFKLLDSGYVQHPHSKSKLMPSTNSFPPAASAAALPAIQHAYSNGTSSPAATNP